MQDHDAFIQEVSQAYDELNTAATRYSPTVVESTHNSDLITESPFTPLSSILSKFFGSETKKPPTTKKAEGGVQKATPNHTVDSVFDKLIQAESRGQHRDKSGRLTTSPVGAQGITQVMPMSGKDPGYGVQPLQNDSQEEYIRFGKDLLGAYTKELGGDIRKGLAAYNWGIGNMKKALDRHGDNWESKLPKETKDYLKKIVGKQDG